MNLKFTPQYSVVKEIVFKVEETHLWLSQDWSPGQFIAEAQPNKIM